MEILELNNNNFNENVFIKGKTVLVDFYTEWCMPCKVLIKILEKYSSSKSNSVILMKVDIEANMELAKKYHIYSVPTLMLVKDGEIVKTEPGFKSMEALKKFIEN